MTTTQPSAPLFEADRLAIIGACDRITTPSIFSRICKNMGFDQSKIIPINPGPPEVFGLRAYPSIIDVPGEIPLAAGALLVDGQPVIVRLGNILASARNDKKTGRPVFSSIRHEGGCRRLAPYFFHQSKISSLGFHVNGKASAQSAAITQNPCAPRWL